MITKFRYQMILTNNVHKNQRCFFGALVFKCSGAVPFLKQPPLLLYEHTTNLQVRRYCTGREITMHQ